MNREFINDIKKELKKELTAKRYEHSLGVAYTAAALAMRYDVDVDRAELAGILHDCAKCYKNDELEHLLKKAHIKLADDERATPQIWHAIYGPVLARKKYHIEDSEILSAIRWHTTGHADMSMLEKIIFIADYIEPNRDEAGDLDEIRRMAFDDITMAVYKVSRDTLEYLEGKNIVINSETRNCYEWLKATIYI